MSPKLRTALIILVVLLPLDQLSKLWVEANVSPFEPLVVIDGFFRITHARNSGMALGWLQGMHRLVFIGFTLVALALVGSFFRRIPRDDVMSATALGLILAGALGNLIDRVFRSGEVVDFLQFDLGLFVFPDFNVADSAIVIGVGLLLLDTVVREAERRPLEPDSSESPAP